jgi:hypothetical protein
MELKKLYCILALFFLFFLAGCDNPVQEEQIHGEQTKLQLGFQNNSIHQLSNLTVSGKLIGNLQSGASSEYFKFESFRFDTGLPDEDASAEVDGKMFTNYHRGYWCGTEKITIDSGKYLIEIEVIDTVLFLSCKNAPTIFDP